VIAFAVDFYTGAIYLPARHGHAANIDAPANRPQDSSHAGVSQALGFDRFAKISPFGMTQPKTSPPGFRKISVPRDQLHLRSIEQIVSAHVGQPVLLQEDSRVSELAGIEAFDAQIRQHHSDQRFGHSLRKFLSV
jgi:hypothetical protein